MKKRILVTMPVILVLMAGLFLPALAGASTIGYVDFELLFYAHPEYDLKNKELQDKIEELLGEAQAKAQSMETEEEIDELSAYYEMLFDQIEQEVRVELVSFILNIIEEVADALGVEVVLPENSVIYGGANLTEQVIEAMYKAYGVSVPSSVRELL